ncbi:stabilizer of axonemal microtubules 1 isoform X2 [Hyperolius riggenbachi]|uniref:stabilizer of axonemal microtubules 1 isoform X2 n=1 Tax=Hyperolius riggenbachi TaxID=752182 RepID=UPI0035A39B10
MSDFYYLLRHRCPYLASRLYENLDEPCFLSEYADMFTMHQCKPVTSCKPKDVYHKSPKEMEFLSTFRSDYVPHAVMPKKLQVLSKYEPSKEHMDLNTIYKQDYCPYCVRPCPSFKPLQSRIASKSKMDSKSTYKGDYQLWNTCKRQSMKPPNAYRPPTGKFDIKSTFQDHFQFWSPCRSRSCKPINVSLGSQVPFDSLTNYRVDYIPYTVQRIRLGEKEKYKPSDEPFDSLTTNKQDYKGLPGETTKSLKPIHGLVKWGIPFNHTSEFQDKYKVWPQPPPYEKKILTYTEPTGKMDLLSTTQCDYTPHMFQPKTNFKPVSQYQKHSDNFEAISIMKEDYKPWRGKKTTPLKPQAYRINSSGPFLDMTTVKHDYVPHPLQYTMSFKPANKAFISSAPMDDQTTHRTTYTVKPFQVCPFQKVADGHDYIKNDANGQRRYEFLPGKENHLSDFATVPKSARLFPPIDTFTSPTEVKAAA